jgi:hypothetical protein
MARVISLFTVYYNGEAFLEMNQSETRIASGHHVHVGILILIFFLACLAKYNVSFWHHLASIVCCLSSVNFSHILHGGHSIDASYQVLVILVDGFPRRRLKKIGQSETRIAWSSVNFSHFNLL